MAPDFIINYRQFQFQPYPLLIVCCHQSFPSMHNRRFWHTFDLDVFDKAVVEEVKPLPAKC